jgi:hypothetical protein
MSLVLASSSDILKVVLDAAPATNQCPVGIAYAIQGGNAARAIAVTNGATAVSALTGPSSGNPYVINSIQFPNIDTAQRKLTVELTTSSGTQQLMAATLQSGSQLYYDSARGWYVLDQYGNELISLGLPAGVTITTPNIIGVTNGSNAAAGSVGEVISNTATGVSVASNVYANATSITLTPGDWDVEGSYYITGTTFSAIAASISTTSATLAAAPNAWQFIGVTITSGGSPVPKQRINVSSTTTVYLVGTGAFSSGTATAAASIIARRAR